MKILIAYRHSFLITDDFVGSEGEGASILKQYFSVLEGSYSIFGALSIKKDGNGKPELLSYLFNSVNSYLMLLMRAV